MFSARQGYNDNASDTQSLILRINPIKTGGPSYATWKFYGIGSYIIDWGDGKVQSTSGAATHTYSIADKDYIVRIRNCTGINSNSDYLDLYNFAILEIQQWGTSIWTSLTQAFQFCKNLTTISAIDAPNLSSITNLSYLFSDCPKLNGDLTGWDTSTITNMNRMFYSLQYGPSTSNCNITTWNTANVTNMAGMFYACYAFNQPIGSWNVSAVTRMDDMFAGRDLPRPTIFNQDISNWNLRSAGVNMSNMFAWNTGLTSSTYSQILIGWKNKVVANGGPNTVTFTANLTKYNSSAVVARTYLTSTAHWTITDAGLV